MENDNKYKKISKFLGFRSDRLLVERWRSPRLEMVKYFYIVPLTNLGINRS